MNLDDIAQTFYEHVRHPHVDVRSDVGPPKVDDQRKTDSKIDRFNTSLALRITTIVGTMWCAYVFAGIAMVSLPAAFKSGNVIVIVSWVTQTFFQLVLLSVILLGQNIQAKASDKRAEATYLDAEAVLEDTKQIQEHLVVQDNELARLIAANSTLHDKLTASLGRTTS